MAVRLRIFKTTVEAGKLSYLVIAKAIALPTAKRKLGNTRSVGVNPCQLACSKGEKGSAPEPGVFTMIIKQTVIPLRTSRARKRGVLTVVILQYIKMLQDQYSGKKKQKTRSVVSNERTNSGSAYFQQVIH